MTRLSRIACRSLRRRIVFVSLFLGAPGSVCSPTLVQPAQAQPTTFTGSAMVPLLGEGDVVKARATALSEALSRALEQAVAEVMPEARSRVYLVSSRAREYVTTYRVLQEGEVAGQFQLRIEAQLDLPRLQRDLLGSTGATAATPSVVRVCSPQNSDVARVALDAARAQLKDVGSVEDVSSTGCTDPPDANALRGAAALLSFAPTVDKAEPIRGTQPVVYGAQGRGAWHLWRPGQEPLHEPAEAVGFGPDAASAESEAARQAAQVGLSRLLVRSGPLLRRSDSVLVRVENFGSFRAYQQIVRVLASLPGVSRVSPRLFHVPARGSSDGDEAAQLLLSTSASVETLGATLGRTPIPGLRLQVAPVHAGELRVVCVSSDAVPSAAQPVDAADAAESEKIQ